MNWRQIARAAARRYGYDPDLFEAQMGVENPGGGDVTSPAGALGPAQIMPATAKAWGVKNPHDIYEAYDAAAKHMADYARQYGTRGALVAYNAGPGMVGKALPAETQAYIQRIMGGKKPASVGARPVANSLRKMQAPDGGVGAAAPNIFAQFAQQQPVNVIGTNPMLQQIQKTTQENWALMADLQTQMQAGRQAIQQGGGGAGPALSKHAPESLMAMFEEANRISKAHMPYSWGGGHDKSHTGGKLVPLDCSGAVSQVLGIDPRVAADYMSWGKPGKGQNVTIYANQGHVLMEINGHFWGTSRANPGGGAGWIPRSAIPDSYLKNFVARHPQGM